jgi:hypothetical protein
MKLGKGKIRSYRIKPFCAVSYGVSACDKHSSLLRTQYRNPLGLHAAAVT